MNEIERLLATEQIKVLKARYFRYVDTKQWDDFGALFPADAEFEDLSQQVIAHGPAEIVALCSGVLDAGTSVHMGSMPEIEVHDAERASGIWAMQDVLRFPGGASFPGAKERIEHVEGAGHYVEDYVCRDGTWMFQRILLTRLQLRTVSLTSADVIEGLARRAAGTG